MRDVTSPVIPRCTAQRENGAFCDLPSVDAAPFPICSKHALDVIHEFTEDELESACRSTRETGPRSSIERRERNAAIEALTNGRSMLYAVEVEDDVVKIGVTTNFRQRRYALGADAVLALVPGDRDDEQAIHASLAEHRARGREYYHRAPQVIEVINGMRQHFNLPPLTA